MKILIVDDELPVRQTLAKLIERCSIATEVVGEAPSIKVAKELIESLEPDVVLLDIMLSDGTGFDLLESLPQRNFQVIFITAYQEFAVKAFRFSALDYLLKPVDSEDLIAALERASEQVDTDQMDEMMNLFQQYMSEQRSSWEKIVLRTAEAIHVTKVEDIMHCESFRNYTTIFLKNGAKIVVSQTIKHFEELLKEYGFFRPHQSHLINMDYLKRFDKSDGGLLVLTDETEIPVSTRKREVLMSLLR